VELEEEQRWEVRTEVEEKKEKDAVSDEEESVH